jgi:hypothetical protein
VSEFKQMVELTEKLFYYLDTFEINGGRETARQIILDELRRDMVEKKMRQLRAKYSYERGAREYYNKHGTVGEF